MQSSSSADDTSALPSCTGSEDYRTASLDQQPFQKDLTQQNEQIEVEVIALADGRVIAARLEIAFLLQCYFIVQMYIRKLCDFRNQQKSFNAFSTLN